MLGFAPLSTTPISALPETATSDLSATLAVTLDDVTISAAGSLAIAGQANVTLDEATLSSTASLEIAASASITLDNVTLSSTGALAITGSEAATLDDVTVSATGELLISAELAVTLDDVTESSDAFLTNHAYLDVTLDDVVLYSDATLRLPNSGGFGQEKPRKRRKSQFHRAEQELEKALAKTLEPKRKVKRDLEPWLAEIIEPPDALDVPEFNPEIAGLSDYVSQLQAQLAQRKFELSQMEADDELLLLSL